jgi:septum site-determining protein MinD
LAARGKRVLLIDADAGLRSIDMMLGITDAVAYDLGDVLKARCTPAQALCRVPDAGDLFAVAAPQLCEESGSPGGLRKLLHGYARYFDVVLVDCPAGLDDGFHRAVATADEAIVVTTPHISALRDADKVITVLKSYRLNELSVVLNKVRGDLLMTGDCLSPGEVEELLKTPLSGLLPEEYGICRGDLHEIHPAFRVLANNLLTGRKKLYDVTKKYSGFFGNLRRVLRRNL